MSSSPPLVFIVQDELLYQTYAWLCAQADVPYVRAEGGLHALTQLERTHASAIICEKRLADMQALELWSIIRSDPATHNLPFFLLADKAPTEFTAAVDHTIGRATCTPLALSRILASAFPQVALPPFLSSTATPSLHCDLRTFSLTELIAWLNENQKTGHWIIKIEEASGYLIMQKGELIYGEFTYERGQDSLLALILESLEVNKNNQHVKEDISYFEAGQLAEGYPRNIDMSTRRLLVSATVSIDHLNAEIIG